MCTAFAWIKWLWAARFFKTRALAKKSDRRRQVDYDGGRVKTRKKCRQLASFVYKRGRKIEVEVVSLAVLPEARKLYAENG